MTRPALTAELLRNIALTLDALSAVARDLIDSARHAPDGTGTLTVTLTYPPRGDGRQWWQDAGYVERLWRWVSSTEQQDDLRRWADELDAS